MNRKKKENAAQSTRQLMGIDGIKDYCIATRMGDLVFFIIKPTNISVLSDSSISARIYALLNVVKGQAEIEMLALNSKESFERNKNFYQERMGNEELPAIRRLLEQDSKHLDRIQVLMASSREFYIIIRLRSEKETEVVIVTLPETTPVFEAQRLQQDLQRARIKNKWWVVNSSLLLTSTNSPFLKAKALSEVQWINKVKEISDGNFAVIEWKEKV